MDLLGIPMENLKRNMREEERFEEENISRESREPREARGISLHISWPE